MSKSKFTERFVIPQTRKASKYITVYREIAENYFYIGDSPDQEQNNSEEDKFVIYNEMVLYIAALLKQDTAGLQCVDYPLLADNSLRTITSWQSLEQLLLLQRSG
ncbi:hypothetical protein KIL84_002714 [Mauremys mutica]|uniref:Uncharacterized protein n=1 Tax=Mauremys mutica TaxID=74926 RepID=A0A9D3WUF0_9SAUR|nr:hypothetical protein KIL84_002714 [Mauremys mutica]